MNILEKVIVFFGLTYIVYAFIDVIVQRIKYNRKPKTELDGDVVDKLQKLAGIKPHETGFLKNISPRLFDQTNDKVIEEMVKAAETSDFPAPNETISVKSTPITKIQVGTYTNDPLSDISLSRVSKEAKEQMAEIARKDIEKTLEAEAQKIEKMKADFENNPYPQTIEELEAYEPVNNMGKWAKQVRLESMKKEKAKKTKKS